ncbi:MAG: hydrogenase expression/formation protein HypE, partial [Anaerolineae bacterium]|nr:hydrogenase expression/formation protein HypE [Anaerolineae bacterium]
APVLALIDAGIRISCLRDLTRGGLATTMVEIARAAHLHLEVDDRVIAVREDVAGACEILGLDPLYVANEGRFAAFVRPDDVERTLQILRLAAPNQEPALIGHVLGPDDVGYVTLRSRIGVPRVLDMLTGEQLPRIC